MTESLSSAALAVLKTACIHHGLFNEEIVQRRRMVAAALRAAADQVVPEWKTTPGGSKVWQSEPVPSIRAELLAIAAELGGAQ